MRGREERLLTAQASSSQIRGASLCHYGTTGRSTCFECVFGGGRNCVEFLAQDHQTTKAGPRTALVITLVATQVRSQQISDCLLQESIEQPAVQGARLGSVEYRLEHHHLCTKASTLRAPWTCASPESIRNTLFARLPTLSPTHPRCSLPILRCTEQDEP